MTPTKLLLLTFYLTCSGYIGIYPEIIRAQTTVCSGDSVVLVLDGYKQGDIYWKQSDDRITWSNATGTTYNDSLVLVATNTYYYRALVIEGMCSPFYSDTTLVIVNPTPPIAKQATDITQISFSANWSAVASATDYFLDVATNATFTSFVTGCKNITVSSIDTTYLIDGLTCNTTYYYRVRDSSDACTTTSDNSNTITVATDTCPAPVSCGIITDSRDNKTYKTIIIGTQCWMARNLDVGNRIDGILHQTPGTDNQFTSIEKYCYLDNADSCTRYGGLYVWDEMMAYGSTVSGDKGPQGICPTGWHLPTDNEWTTLQTTLGATTTAGGKIKDTATHLWQSPNTGATNSSGFTVLPGGYRDIYGSFNNQAINAYFWTTTENLAYTAWNRNLAFNNALVSRNPATKALTGYSVRCVKD